MDKLDNLIQEALKNLNDEDKLSQLNKEFFDMEYMGKWIDKNFPPMTDKFLFNYAGLVMESGKDEDSLLSLSLKDIKNAIYLYCTKNGGIFNVNTLSVYLKGWQDSTLTNPKIVDEIAEYAIKSN